MAYKHIDKYQVYIRLIKDSQIIPYFLLSPPIYRRQCQVQYNINGCRNFILTV